jgi:hypothetical protein
VFELWGGEKKKIQLRQGRIKAGFEFTYTLGVICMFSLKNMNSGAQFLEFLVVVGDFLPELIL